MATRRLAGRRRAAVAAALVGFVLVATGVIWRRSIGLGQSRVLRAMDAQRVSLEAERARLERDIRSLAGRGALQPIVERRLHMHVPNDSQVVILPRRARGAR